MMGVVLRLGIIVGWTSLLYVLYQVTNRWHLLPPRQLPLTPLDQAIPFWPATVVPYFLLIGGMYLPALVDDRRLFLRALAALTIASLINFLCFTLVPTTYPRPEAPMATEFPVSWYHWLVSIDTPANCFPSGHITAPTIGVWALTTRYPHLHRWCWPLLALLALSVLTTKQHYVVDILGGAATAWAGIRLSRRWMPTLDIACSRKTGWSRGS